MSNINSFGSRLREERKKIGMSQKEFGAIGGVSYGAQSNYETGRRAPDATYLAAVKDTIDLYYVLTGKSFPSQQRVSDAMLVAMRLEQDFDLNPYSEQARELCRVLYETDTDYEAMYALIKAAGVTPKLDDVSSVTAKYQIDNIKLDALMAEAAKLPDQYLEALLLVAIELHTSLRKKGIRKEGPLEVIKNFRGELQEHAATRAKIEK